MNITSDYLLSYMKSLDSRIASQDDVYITEKIRHSIYNLSSETQCFFKTEEVSIQSYTDDGIYTFEFIPSYDIIDYYEVKVIDTNSGTRSYSDITLEKTNDNTYFVSVQEPFSISEPISIKFSYFYYFNFIIGTSFDVVPEVWNMMKHTLNTIAWEDLKDYQKADYHRNELMKIIQRRVTPLPHQFSETDMKGGFL